MIIKPQIYSLRLVIVVLSTLICTLGIYSYYNYTSLNKYHKFLLEENNLVEAELKQMSSDYSALQIDNRDIQEKLEASKIRIARVLDSVKYLKPDVYLVSHYKKQLEAIKIENKKILALVDELNTENEFLKQEALRVGEELDQTISLSQSLKSKNSTLSKINKNYIDKINKAKLLTIDEVSIKGVRRVTNSGNIKTTSSARRAKMLNLCFTIPSNEFASKGQKELYLQILDPKNNVVSDKGHIEVGETSLIYSEKIVVDYNNTSINKCVFIQPSEDEDLLQGDYYVTIYHNNMLVGKTTLSLK